LQILVFYRFWGKVNDRISPNFTMLLSMCLYVPEMLLWAFMTDKSVRFILPVCYVISSINASGFAIGNFNRRYELTPDEGWVLYDSFANALIALMFLVSPFLATLLRKVAQGLGAGEALENGHIRVVYLISALLLLLLQAFCYLSLKRKSPEDPALKKESYKTAAVILWRSVFGGKR
jgi:MFS family permease